MQTNWCEWDGNRGESVCRKNLEDTVPLFGEKPLYTNITVEDVAKVMELEDMWLLFHYNEQALGDTEYDCHESLQVFRNVTRDVGGMFRIGVLSLDPNSVAGATRPEAEAAGVDVRYLANHVYALPPVKTVSTSNRTISGYLYQYIPCKPCVRPPSCENNVKNK